MKCKKCNSEMKVVKDDLYPYHICDECGLFHKENDNSVAHESYAMLIVSYSDTDYYIPVLTEDDLDMAKSMHEGSEMVLSFYDAEKEKIIKRKL